MAQLMNWLRYYATKHVSAATEHPIFHFLLVQERKDGGIPTLIPLIRAPCNLENIETQKDSFFPFVTLEHQNKKFVRITTSFPVFIRKLGMKFQDKLVGYYSDKQNKLTYFLGLQLQVVNLASVRQLSLLLTLMVHN